MAWKILVSAPYMQSVIEQYRAVLDESGVPVELVLPQVRERLSEDELLEWISDIDGVISGDDAFTERVLLAAPKLKVISKWGTGVDSIDRESAARLGIAVCNTPDAFSQGVADTVLGYMLCFARQLPWMDQDMRSGLWNKRPSFALGEAVLGVIGVGNVGKAVVKRAKAFGMKVLGNDIATISSSFVAETGIEAVAKEELLGRADFVSLNCDLNSTSYHLIGEKELALMKPTAYLINTARGPLVDEAALIKALRSGGICGVALDVFEEEPLPQQSPLRHMTNCLLAPHNANSSPEAYRRVHENTIRNLLIHLRRGGGMTAS
jgi:D-3-phosphoglycerate dehydrogenase